MAILGVGIRLMAQVSVLVATSVLAGQQHQASDSGPAMAQPELSLRLVTAVRRLMAQKAQVLVATAAPVGS